MKLSALDIVNGQSNPSHDAIRTASITVGSEFDTVPPRFNSCNSRNIRFEEAAEEHRSQRSGEAINGQHYLAVEERIPKGGQEICEESDTEYLVQSKESFRILT